MWSPLFGRRWKIGTRTGRYVVCMWFPDKGSVRKLCLFVYDVPYLAPPDCSVGRKVCSPKSAPSSSWLWFLVGGVMLLSEGCSLLGSCKLTDFFTFLRHTRRGIFQCSRRACYDFSTANFALISRTRRLSTHWFREIDISQSHRNRLALYFWPWRWDWEIPKSRNIRQISSKNIIISYCNHI